MYKNSSQNLFSFWYYSKFTLKTNWQRSENLWIFKQKARKMELLHKKYHDHWWHHTFFKPNNACMCLVKCKKVQKLLIPWWPNKHLGSTKRKKKKNYMLKYFQIEIINWYGETSVLHQIYRAKIKNLSSTQSIYISWYCIECSETSKNYLYDYVFGNENIWECKFGRGNTRTTRIGKCPKKLKSFFLIFFHESLLDNRTGLKKLSKLTMNIC